MTAGIQAPHQVHAELTVGDPAQDGRVVDQLQPGYRFGERLLRAAKVVVGRHASAAT